MRDTQDSPWERNGHQSNGNGKAGKNGHYGRNGHNGNGHSPADELLPPNSEEAEMGVVGSILQDPITAGGTAITRIGQNYDAFYDPKYRLIYRCIVEMHETNIPIDLINLVDWIRFQGELETIGGITFLSQTQDSVAHHLNIGSYIDTLLEHWNSRRLIKLCGETCQKVFDREDTTPGIIDLTSQRIYDLAAEGGAAAEEEMALSDLIPGAMTTIDNVCTHQQTLTGIATGFLDLDATTTGLHPGEMVVLAARPGHGKTSLAMNVADNVAVEQGFPVGVFSLEMTKESLAMRMICSRARVNLRTMTENAQINPNQLPNPFDMQRLTESCAALNHASITINDRASLSILALRTRARRMQQMRGIRLLIIDYLQLLSAERKYNDNREEEIRYISAGIKALAKELNIPVLALAQLNRQVEHDNNRRPRLSDLRGSGSIEQDADQVWMLYKKKDSGAEVVNLYVAKQRNGPLADIPLVFLKAFTRFENAVMTGGHV